MDEEQQLYTCISCAVAFIDPALQRQHFATDWHRYNMKRRVAALPPVSALNFNQKVLERREQTAVRPDPRDMQCAPCRKAFATENAYRSHMVSKKHKAVESKAAEAAAERARLPVSEEQQEGGENANAGAISDEVPSYDPDEGKEDIAEVEEEETNKEQAPESVPRGTEAKAESSTAAARLLVDQDATEQDVEMSIDAKIAASRRQLSATDCLFCTIHSNSVEENMKHMSRAHSFFIPDMEYLVDLEGLLIYLGEKLAIGNVCLFCPNGGKEFGSLAAVRAHMKDRAHCKVAYDSDADRLELSDYYDFSSSYADAGKAKSKRKSGRSKGKARAIVEDVDEEWEDDEDMDGEDADEVVVLEGSEEEDSEDEDESDSELSDEEGPTIGADGLSLRLPSGRTLGHRSLNTYYKQNLRPLSESTAGRELALTTKLRNVKERLNDPTKDLISTGGGSGAHGKGQMVMRARNSGEARWTKKVSKQHRDLRVIADHKTRVGYVHNSQKHFRDPLLQ